MASPLVLSRFAHGFRRFASPAPGSIKPLCYAGYDAIRKQAENGNLTGHVFIDLSKALDTISYAGLLKKYIKNGFSVKLPAFPLEFWKKVFTIKEPSYSMNSLLT